LWNSFPARTAWFISASWPTSASSRPKTSSKWVTKFGSNAWAWMKKAASASHAKPRWPSAIRKWAAEPDPKAAKASEFRMAIRVNEANEVSTSVRVNAAIEGPRGAIEEATGANAAIAVGAAAAAAGADYKTARRC